jgi:hypothetical protein
MLYEVDFLHELSSIEEKKTTKHAIITCLTALTLVGIWMPDRTQAQGSGPLASIIAQASTNTCCTGPCGTVCLGCASTTFVAPFSGDATIKYDISCAGGADCRNCLGCVWLEDKNGPIPGNNCHSSHACGTGTCTVDCSANPVQLTGGVTYTLRVCKLPCTTSDCDHCTSACTLTASVSM